MVYFLFQNIQELENKLSQVQKNLNDIKDDLSIVMQECKVKKDKKQDIQESFKNILCKLNLECEKPFFNQKFNRYVLNYQTFIKIASTDDNFHYLTIIDADISIDKIQFTLGFLIKKISPYFSFHENKILGILDKEQAKALRELDVIPFFNPATGEFDELNLFKMLFESDKFDAGTIIKAEDIFEDTKSRPKFRRLKTVKYSFFTNKIIDSAFEELQELKSNYTYVFNMSYPQIEIKLREEIKNTPFLLVTLEKIENEQKEISKSKGLANVVKRIINYIENNSDDKSLQSEIKYIRKQIKL